MKNNKEIQKIIEMLNKFIAREDCSMEIAGKIEVALDEIFPDDDEIQDYVTCFASYRPGGGDYLYDEDRMVVESKTLLNIIQSKNIP
ncbi:hypothetical protein [Clostridium sp. 'White wine YQ']|uniref:hypothetical protein n=1 Tax=Clostridium sp. 'White wine YQ' TaxID=3027474 RepID=UPI002365D9F0|nr:hypothetical protein [Clostridium sp. 'White wine YQ']MDD7793072.1 hypothetical protein [Clostridium sp. 'White wine YQ']